MTASGAVNRARPKGIILSVQADIWSSRYNSGEDVAVHAVSAELE